MPTDATPTTDGRRARRERGRVAAATALIDLVLETGVVPAAEQVAERAGISSASLFRYFDTLDDLRDHAQTIYFDRYADMLTIPKIGDGSLAQRIHALVQARITLYRTTAPMAALMRVRASDVPASSTMLRQAREMFADQVSQHFDAELSEFTKAQRDDLIPLIALNTSFESWVQLTDHFGRSDKQVARSWARVLTSVLDASRQP